MKRTYFIIDLLLKNYCIGRDSGKSVRYASAYD